MKSIVYINSYNAPEIDKKEILRYAGVEKANHETEALLDECIAEVKKLLTYKVCYARFTIAANADRVDLGFAKSVSHSLAICLKDCEEIIVFCATVGVDLDRLIKKYSIISPSRALVLQAIGSERVEVLCDIFCLDIAAEEVERGRRCCPRFSPGYGDLALELQRDIFLALDCTRKIGVSLGDNLLMTPTKSVTAIIGIKKVK